jgi:hypothetical protein
VYEQKEVEKTVSKMQEVIETTYLMMQESQKRLVRLVQGKKKGRRSGEKKRDLLFSSLSLITLPLM